MADIQLTDKENTQVEKKKKPTKDLPKYFSATFNKELQISRDFEKFLILKENDSKQDAINWLTEVNDLRKTDSDRDAILNEAVSFDLKSAEKEQKELNDFLNEFDTFRTSFTAGKFASVIEVGELFSDLQSKIGFVISKRDRVTYQKIYLNLFSVKAKKEQSNSTKDKQLESWAKPLSAYLD